MNLHDAIRKILLESKGPMTAKEIAEAINLKHLYKREDLKPVPVSQVLARIHNYKEIFERDGEFIILKNLSGVLLDKLLETSIKWFRNMSAHGIVSVNGYIVIPFCFFFKRVIDNRDLQINLFNEPKEIDCSRSEILKFVEQLKKANIKLQQPLSELIEPLLRKNFEDVDLLLQEIAEIDLREGSLPHIKFSDFYLRTIRTLINQEFYKGLFYTPDTIAEIFSKLAGLAPFNKIYNPAAGISSLPIMLRRNNDNQQFLFSGDEIESHIFLLAFTNLIINKININDFNLGDSLRRPYQDSGDLIVCNPPMNVILPNKWSFSDPPVSNIKKSHQAFLASIIARLNSWNRAIIIVPEAFLFSNETVDRQIKGHILRKGLLEGIISLPSGIFQPYSSIKTSIIVLNSKKKDEFTYLIDGEHPYFRKNQERNEVILDSERIISTIRQGLEKIDSMTPEELLVETQSKRKSEYSSIRSMSQFDYNLVVKRFLIMEDGFEELDNKKLIKLSEILEFHHESKSKANLKYVNISNLNSDYIDFRLKTEDLKVEEKPGNYLEGKALLLGSISGSYKPTFFEGEEPILVSPNIHVFRIKLQYWESILPEYIVYEMATKEFSERLNQLAVGSTSMTRVHRTDLLSIKFYIPSLEEQKAIIKAKKEAVLNSKDTEVSSLASRLGLEKKTSLNYLGFIQHEYNNVAGGINNYLETIKRIIAEKPIDVSTRLSGRKDSPTVLEALESIKENLDSIKDLFDPLNTFINISSAKLNINDNSFLSVIDAGCNKILCTSEEFILLKGINKEFEHVKDRIIPVDQEMFSLIISNFISNSKKHGYDKDSQEKILIFELIEDDDYFYINLINNGKPFTEDFSAEDFVEFGKRSGENKGSGLGGFIMNEVVKKHGGKLSILPIKEILQIKTKTSTFIISSGIQFQIQLNKIK
jgi:type I restriction enzyme M protein